MKKLFKISNLVKMFGLVLLSISVVLHNNAFASTTTTSKIISKLSISKIQDISVVLNQGDKYTLPATVAAIISNKSTQKIGVTWNTKKIDTSKCGKYTFIGSVKGYNNKVKLTLTVTTRIVKVSSVTLNKVTYSLNVGTTDTLITTINPVNATNKNVKWTSSNTSVAKVDNTGKVTAISEGSATIMVTTADGGYISTCTVKVTRELTIKQIFKKYVNAVVCIEVSDKDNKTISNGSGFIVNSNGTVVTNFHVIKGCAYAKVTLQNGTKYDVKSVLNYNEKQDIAILKLSNVPNLNIVKLGDSNTMEIGDNVIAIGSPQGYENTLSTGIISGINRKNDRGNDFQTTASITYGSSGGALFDIYGNVIGITYSGCDSSGNIGFVIPINEVRPFLNSSNEQTLMQVNNIQDNNTEKFSPLLSYIH